MALVICSVVAVVVAIFWIVNFFSAKTSKLKHVPGPPGRPLVGHLFYLLQPSYHRTLFKWCQQYGELYRINVLGVQGLVVSCPKIISQLLGQERGTPGLPKLSAYEELNMVGHRQRAATKGNIIELNTRVKYKKNLAGCAYLILILASY